MCYVNREVQHLGKIIFNGISSEDLGLEVDMPPAEYVPRKRITTITVPGRQEPLHQCDGTYEPFTKRYECWFKATPVAGAARRIKRWLLSAPAGARLEDSYDADVFHHATYRGGVDIENALDKFGRVTLEFECAAPGYLKSGEMPIRIPGNTTTIVRNDTENPAYPMIIIHGNGKRGCTVDVGGHEIAVLLEYAKTQTIYFDCAIHEAWEMADGVEQPINNSISITIHSFPQLAPGDNLVQVRGIGADYIELIPRTWEL